MNARKQIREAMKDAGKSTSDMAEEVCIPVHLLQAYFAGKDDKIIEDTLIDHLNIESEDDAPLPMPSTPPTKPTPAPEPPQNVDHGIPAEVKEHVGHQIRRQRETLGISQRTVEKACGMGISTLSRIETHGNRFASSEVIDKVLRYLKTAPHATLTPKQKPGKKPNASTSSPKANSTTNQPLPPPVTESKPPEESQVKPQETPTQSGNRLFPPDNLTINTGGHVIQAFNNGDIRISLVSHEIEVLSNGDILIRRIA